MPKGIIHLVDNEINEKSSTYGILLEVLLKYIDEHLRMSIKEYKKMEVSLK
jgi:hypothetical protein